MNKCKFCGATLNEKEPLCEYCNMYNKEVIEDIENKNTLLNNTSETKQEPVNDIYESTLKKSSKIFSILSFITALPPYLLFLYWIINGGEGLGMVILVILLYSLSIGIIPAIICLVTSIIALKKDKTNKLAKASLIMLSPPYLFILIILLTGIFA